MMVPTYHFWGDGGASEWVVSPSKNIAVGDHTLLQKYHATPTPLQYHAAIILLDENEGRGGGDECTW